MLRINFHLPGALPELGREGSRDWGGSLACAECLHVRLQPSPEQRDRQLGGGEQTEKDLPISLLLLAASLASVQGAIGEMEKGGILPKMCPHQRGFAAGGGGSGCWVIPRSPTMTQQCWREFLAWLQARLASGWPYPPLLTSNQSQWESGVEYSRCEQSPRQHLAKHSLITAHARGAPSTANSMGSPS